MNQNVVGGCAINMGPLYYEFPIGRFAAGSYRLVYLQHDLVAGVGPYPPLYTEFEVLAPRAVPAFGAYAGSMLASLLVVVGAVALRQRRRVRAASSSSRMAALLFLSCIFGKDAAAQPLLPVAIEVEVRVDRVDQTARLIVIGSGCGRIIRESLDIHIDGNLVEIDQDVVGGCATTIDLQYYEFALGRFAPGRYRLVYRQHDLVAGVGPYPPFNAEFEVLAPQAVPVLAPQGIALLLLILACGGAAAAARMSSTRRGRTLR